MYDFTLSIPTRIVFSSGNREELYRSVLSYGRKVLLVYGGRSIKNIGLYDEITRKLTAANAELYELSGVVSNPRHTKVDEGALLCRDRSIDVILAVGGGSVIDCAKAISVTAGSAADCWDIITKKAIPVSAIPVITVVTITGTGTEMNNSCVITNEELKIKRGYSSSLLYPRVSFLDPELTFSVPAFQTACGCADILSHIMDTAYFMPGDRMELLRSIMEAMGRTVIKYGPIAVAEPSNYEARANLMWASALALNGILKNGIHQPAVCHIIEHELSAYYDITHGLGMAVILPRWIRYVLDGNTAGIFAGFGRAVFGLSDSDDITCAEKTVDALERFLYSDLSLPSRLSPLGVPDTDFDQMGENVCWEGKVGGLKPLVPGDIVNILRLCY